MTLAEAFPLNELAVGQRMRLVRVAGGQRLKRRLLALGLNIGGEIEIVQRRGGGVVLARGSNRVAIGAGIAQRLFGEVLD
ncbi:MAG: ferrous iron transport protein A [Gammaproteobacteria bacterium]|nr:ferrous iron transport protein A [Gammaproteobacteria bacterium]MCB1924629.1 ferrous iron transport protein A [Gammaproteobacteria bacterium]